MARAPEDRTGDLRAQAFAAMEGLGVDPAQVRTTSRAGVQRKRGPGGGSLLRLSLVEQDGLLSWEVTDVSRRENARKRGARFRGPGGEDAIEIHSIDFERIPPSEVTAGLDALDHKLSPERGLRVWRDGTLTLVPAPTARRGERVLLIVHGTFSRGEAITDQLAKAPGGRDLFAHFGRNYKQVLTFDHPTLAVSPMLNAYDLERALGGCEATFDVVAHSRGGLVARAWADGFRGGTRGVGRLVLVGTPLAGTSLAAPYRLRHAMKYLANVGGALTGLFGLGAANPFLAVGAGVMKVLGSVTSFLGDTPVLDAAVAMIPGLAAQSRVGNAPEILRLRESSALPPESVYVVRADFEPASVGWNFLRLFRNLGQRLADVGADLLFPGANDLVVDTDSINDLAVGRRVAPARMYDFKTQGTVHHCNYFLQRETVQFLRGVLPGK